LDFISAASTRLGRRVLNEDAYVADSARGVWVVADGFGGEAGRVAASAAVESAHSTLVSRAVAVGGRKPSDRLLEAFDAAHEQIKRATIGLHPSGGAALCACLAANGRFWIGNHGDTAALFARGGRVERLTSDHTVRTEVLSPEGYSNDLFDAVDSGAEPGFSPALGYHQGYRRGPEVVSVEIAAGDVLLLCTDGLWAWVSDKSIVDVLASRGSSEVALGVLLERAQEAGSSDNATAVLVYFSATSST
jgi:protein phosphatase